MPTNLAIDDKLLGQAQRIGKFRTKRDTVNEALKEFVEKHEQKKILKALGTIEFRQGWNYKKERRSREAGR